VLQRVARQIDFARGSSLAGMYKLLVASLIALGCSSSVVAAPRAPNASVVFEMAEKLKIQSSNFPTSRFSLRADGRWTYVVEVDGKVTKRRGGVLARGSVQKIRTALAAATWQFTLAEMRCMAEAMTFTELSANGSVVWTDEMCSGRILDANSRKRLETVMAIVNPLIAAS
jgi:hypothetical protein